MEILTQAIALNCIRHQQKLHLKSYIAQTFHQSKGHWPSSVGMDATQRYLESIRQWLGENIISYIIPNQFKYISSTENKS